MIRKFSATLLLLAAAQGTAAHAGSGTAVRWNGAPELTAPGGWSLRLRSRAQIDAGALDLPAGIPGSDGKLSAQLRRLYLGFGGAAPGGFTYRFDADIAPRIEDQGPIEITDAFVGWERKAVSVTVGQIYPFLGMEQATSDIDTSFLERANFTSAFNFRRRLGVSAGWRSGDVSINAGYFTENLLNLHRGGDNDWGFDGRMVWAPKAGNAQFHLAASAHLHRQDGADALPQRYRSRPNIRLTDLRLVATPSLAVTNQASYGLEAAVARGPLHAVVEAGWMRPNRTNGSTPNFFGGYAEVGYFLTRGDSRPYKRGGWGPIKPVRGVDKGGVGAVQVNARYEWVDLTSAGVVGGTQSSYLASAIWTPAAHFRWMASYGRIKVRDAAIPNGSRRNYGANFLATRFQMDF